MAFNCKFNSESGNSASEQLTMLCSDLFNTTPISFFGHTRFDESRQLTVMSTNSEYLNYYVNSQQFAARFSNRDWNEFPEGAFFIDAVFSSDSEKQFIHELGTKFQLTNFVTIIEKRSDGCDIFTFASGVEAGDLSSFYLNSIDFLKKFISDLGSKLAFVLKSSGVEPAYIPHSGDEHLDLDNLKSLEKNASLLPDFNVPRAESMPEEKGLDLLTNRELDCLKYIVRGYTSKEIAKELSISFRTVENYSERIKTKLGCPRKRDILLRYSDIVSVS